MASFWDNIKAIVKNSFSPRAQFAIKPDWEKDMFLGFGRIVSSTAIL
jgi:hypothetical protein